MRPAIVCLFLLAACGSSSSITPAPADAGAADGPIADVSAAGFPDAHVLDANLIDAAVTIDALPVDAAPVDAVPNGVLCPLGGNEPVHCPGADLCAPSSPPAPDGGSTATSCVPCGDTGELACGQYGCPAGAYPVPPFTACSDQSSVTDTPIPCASGVLWLSGGETWCVSFPPGTGGPGQFCADIVVDRGGGNTPTGEFMHSCRTDLCGGNLICGNDNMCSAASGC